MFHLLPLPGRAHDALYLLFMRLLRLDVAAQHGRSDVLELQETARREKKKGNRSRG
jgi:hypothetical protein